MCEGYVPEVSEFARRWFTEADDGLRITVMVVPGARRSAIADSAGDVLRLRIAAPPVDGAANVELRRFIAERLGVRQRNVEIVRGAHSRTKVLHISGVATALAVVADSL
jgi:uncharacterized protein (TIGR00251 family)